MFICHCVRPSSQWKWVWKQRSCSQRKQETKSDLSSVMGCLVVTGHLLTAGCLFHQAPSTGMSLPSLSPLLCQDSTAQDRNTGGGHGVRSLGCAASWLLLFPTSPPPLCQGLLPPWGLEAAPGALQFSSAVPQVSPWNHNRMCLVLSPWLQHHLSIGLRPRLVSLDVSERSQTWNKVFAQTCC